MTQNQLITLLSGILLLVIVGSVFVLMQGGTPEPTDTPPTSSEESTVAEGFNLRVLQQQAYQLLNKQLIREGALPVKPAATSGKANPFL